LKHFACVLDPRTDVQHVIAIFRILDGNFVRPFLDEVLNEVAA